MTDSKTLKALATATGALAPPGGVDCDADGIMDILEGEPLVCPVGASGVGIAEAVIAVVEAAIEATAGATAFSRFSGTANGVGRGAKAGMEITGRFRARDRLDLGAHGLTLTIVNLFDEELGSGGGGCESPDHTGRGPAQ